MLQEPHYDCLEMLIAERLNELGFDYREYFWRAGLLYAKNNIDQSFFMGTSGKYHDYYLLNYFGIKYVELFSEDLNSIIKKNKTYIIKLDFFFLEYCHMYKKNHHIHAVIINVNKDFSISIQDNYYGYTGDVSFSKLESWWRDSLRLYQCKVIQLELISTTPKKKADLLSVMEHNYELMTNRKVYNEFSNYNSSYGFYALCEIYVDLQQYITNSEFRILEFFSAEIDKVRKSRKQLADFYELQNEPTLRKLYLEAFNKWSTVYMMLMKIILQKKINLDAKDKVSLIFYEIIKIEIEIMKKTYSNINEYFI